jgi:pimeloyl-ACP methyl ester carboxylesterase
MADVIASDGVRLYAEAHGEGEPLILSPGYCQTHENFRPQVAPFVAAGYRVVLWDYRGHGLSEAPEPDAAYTMKQVVDDLSRVLEWAAPGAPPIVGGLSFGGLASQHFALTHPGRAQALLLIASGPGFKNPKAQAGWESQMGRIADRLEAVGFEGYTSGRAAPNAIGLRPELPAAQAAGRAIEAQDAQFLALVGVFGHGGGGVG